MNLRTILVLFGKEIVQGPKNYLFIFALVVPVIFTLLVTLIFGTFFSGRARLGIVDLGSSQMGVLAQENPALLVRTYPSAAELEAEVGRGALDMGVVLPAGIDSQLTAGEAASITVYVWGESYMNDRIILGTALVNMVRQIAGQEAPVEIVEQVLGTGANIPWEKRLLPLMVLMTIIMAGVMVPATSLVTEKVKRTLTALAVTPATLLDVFAAKGLLGMVLSVFTGTLILFLNRAFGGQPALLVGVLALGALFSASIGVVMGALVKDINTLFATIKSMGIFLYAPGFVYMFPEIPQWIGRIFPTYYIIQPVLQISQQDAGFSEIAVELAILSGLIAVTWVVILRLSIRTQEAQASA
jgi:ABC-2 type transport system permease protein